MKTNRHTIEDLLSDREFIGWVNNPTKESDLYWENVFENHPEKELFLKAKKIASSLKIKETNNDPQQFGRILNNILNDRYSTSYGLVQEKTRKVRNLYIVQFIKAAAVLIIVASLGLFYFTSKDGPPDANQVTEIQIVTKQNPKGQKSTFFLPDSTRVTLNSESYLTYRSDFMNNRVVELCGEAYFDVVNHGDSQFIVKTDDIQTVVMGTSFNVRHFNDENVLIVALNSGKVLVEQISGDPTEKITLQPGEKAIFNKITGKRSKTSYNRELDFAWKDGVLAFQRSSLDDFVKTIERWYDVKVNIIGTPDDEWMISGRFNNETLKNVLESLRFARKISYTLNKDSVTLNF